MNWIRGRDVLSKINFESMIASSNLRLEALRPCTKVDALIVDINNLLYRLSHVEGKNVERVVESVLSKIVMLSNWYGAEYVNTHIVWEGNSTENWRFKHFAGYKGARKNSGDPELRDCVRGVEKVLRGLFKETKFQQWDPIDAEGDDGFSTLAKGLTTKVGIYSTDRDLLQLARNGKVVLIVPQRGASDIEMTETSVRKGFGLPPSKLLDIKALEGDVGDSIPGVPGIGKVRAVSLIQNFESFELLMEICCESSKLDRQDEESLKSWTERLKGWSLTPKRLELLREHKKQAEMSYVIGAIRDDVKMKKTLNSKTSKTRFFGKYPSLSSSRYLTGNTEFLNT